MASQGPFFGTSTSTISDAGTGENANDWLNPTNVQANDGSEASITAATFDANDISFRLETGAFGFTIPAGATIDGIVVEIEKRDQAIGAAVDFRVQLITTSAGLVGDNKADTVTDWPTAATIITYGSSTDGWNASLTPALINDSGFSVALSAKATAANTDIFVDFIRITVHYTEGAGPPPNTGWQGGGWW